MIRKSKVSNSRRTGLGAGCVLASALSVLVAAPGARAAEGAGHAFVRYADVSQAAIVFTYGGDLWVASRDGSSPRRLTVQAGEERNPRFSPDGRFVAYTLTEEGRRGDVYVIPTEGGAARRITYHSADEVMLDWTVDGRQLMFASDQESERNRYRQLYLVDRDGGLPRKLAPPYGENAALTPDGRSLYFTTSPDFQEEAWKRYRGGRAPDIWRMDLATREAVRIAQDDAPDSAPMLRGDTLYFLSERGPEQRSNIFAWREGEQPRQVTHFTDDDVRFPAIGGDAIVFNLAGRLTLLDLQTEKTEAVPLDIRQEDPRLRAETRSVGAETSAMALSANGKVAAFEAHGDVFTLDLENGVASNQSRTPGVAERNPSFAGAGGELLFTSDASGEYALMARGLSGGDPRVLVPAAKGFLNSAISSPDGAWAVFTDDAMRLRIVNLKTRQERLVDTMRWRDPESPDFARTAASWSPDGRYLAYGRDLDNRNSAVVIYDTRTGEHRQLTSGLFSDFSPRFSSDGRYIFALSHRRLDPTQGDIDSTWTYAGSATLTVIPLARDSAVPGGEGWKPPAAAAANFAETWDLAGAEKRLVILTAPDGDLSQLEQAGERLLYLRRTSEGADLVGFNLATLAETKVLANVSDYVVAANGVLLARRRDAVIRAAAADGGAEKVVDLKDLRATIAPLEENRQVVREAWRIERDRFYDPGMHGRDWDGVLTRYLAMADNALTREDITFVVREMVAELGAGHTGAYPASRESMNRRADDVGLLGVDFVRRGDHYAIGRILAPGGLASDIRSPLAGAGVDVREGDYLLAVNGEPVSVGQAPWAAFQGLADKVVELTVNDRPTPDGARRVRVKTLRSEALLREMAWVEANRRYVQEVSGGRLGYVYVRDTARSGQDTLVLQYKAQHHLDGLVIDARFNAGGALGDRLVELLNRPPLVYFNRRVGGDYPLPEQAFAGPKAFLTNGWSYSGGDGFPLLFKAAKIGPVIGTRTAGGLIGPNGYFQLMNGVVVSAAPQRVYSSDGVWPNGNNGVTPDIEVLNNPGALAQGRDEQLDTAITYLKTRLTAPRKQPPKVEFTRIEGQGQ